VNIWLSYKKERDCLVHFSFSCMLARRTKCMRQLNIAHSLDVTSEYEFAVISVNKRTLHDGKAGTRVTFKYVHPYIAASSVVTDIPAV